VEATGTAPFQYTVYYSTNQSDVTSLQAVAAITNTTLASQGAVVLTDVTPTTLSNLTPNTPYYVNVSVIDATELSTLYAGGMFTTLQDLPTLSSSALAIPAGTLGTTSAGVTWTAATPAASRPGALQYQVYYSTSSTAVDSLANIQTGTNVIAFGTWTSSTSVIIPGLSPNQLYYFNVVAQDSAGNQLLYTMSQATTGNQVYLFASGSTHQGNMGGRQGADQICTTAKNKNQAALGCNYIHAFLSVSASDYLANFPTQYGTKNGNFPASSVPFATPNGIQIAPSWTTLLSNQQSNTPTGNYKSSLGGSSNYYWTGSLQNGAYWDAQSCKGWTAGSGTFGDVGCYDLYLYGGFPLCTNNIDCGKTSIDLLCVCW